MITFKNRALKKAILFFAITKLFCGHLSAMNSILVHNKKDNKVQDSEILTPPLSTYQVKQLFIPLSSTSTNTFPLTFDYPHEKLIINYQSEGNCIAQLFHLNNMTRFESRDTKNHNFLLQSVLNTDALTVTTQGSFTFQKPVKTQSASLTGKSVEFLDKFSTEKDLVLDVNYCDNSGNVTCADIWFKGDRFNALSGSTLHVQNTAALLPTQGLFNDGVISCGQDTLINTSSLENWGTIKGKNLRLDGGQVLNEGSINIDDSFLGACETFDHRGKMNVYNDCIFEKVGKFSTTRSSSWKVGGDWKACIDHLNLEGNSTVGNSALFAINSHAILSGYFDAPVLYVDSKDLITCNFTAKLFASYYVGLKAKGWVQFEGDLFNTFVQKSTSEKSSSKLESLLEMFPRGVFLHSEQSGIKKSGNIIEKNGTVSLEAKKGLTHTGLTEAGFNCNSLLSMTAGSLSLEKESILKTLNAQLTAQKFINQFGTIDIKQQLVMEALKIVHGGSLQARTLLAKADTISATESSHIAIENGSLEAEEKIVNAGTLTVSEQLGMKSKNITLETTSRVSAKNAQLQAIETLDNQGNLTISESLITRAKLIENSGTITAQNIHIKADRLWWNKNSGIVSAEDSLTIDALASMNTLGLMQAHSLTINAGIDLNLLGIYRAKNSNINALIGLNAGICIPKIDSLDELITYDNAWKVGEGLLNKYAPTVGVVYVLGKNIVGIYQQKSIYHQGKKFYEQAKNIYEQEDAGVSDLIFLVCEAKNLTTSAIQIGKTMQQGYQLVCPQDENINSSDIQKEPPVPEAANPETVETLEVDTEKTKAQSINWADVACQATANLVSTLGPQMNRDIIIDLNRGILLGMNGNSRSIYNTNRGLSAFANKHIIDTRYGKNTGYLGASNLNIDATSSYDSDGNIKASNLILHGKNSTNIKGDITAKKIAIKSDRYITINSHLTSADIHLYAKVIDQWGLITAQQCVMTGDRISNYGTIDSPKTIIISANLPRISWWDFCGSSFHNKGKLQASDQLFVDIKNVELYKESEINSPNVYFKSEDNWQNNGNITGEQLVFDIKRYMTNNGSLQASKIIINPGKSNDNGQNLYAFSNTGSIQASDQLFVDANNIQLHKSSTIDTPNVHFKSDSYWYNDGNITAKELVLDVKKDITNNGSLLVPKIIVTQGKSNDKGWRENSRSFCNTGNIQASDQLFVDAKNIKLDESSQIDTPNAYFKSDGYWQNDGKLKTKQCIIDSKGKALNTNIISAEQLLYIKAQDILFNSKSHVESKDACYKADHNVFIDGVMDVEKGSVNAGGKVKAIGKIGASTQLDIQAKDIIIERTSQVSTPKIYLRAAETIDSRGRISTSDLFAHAKYVENSGKIFSDNTAHIKADRYFWNALGGSIDVENVLAIDAFILLNTLGYISSDSICTNSIIDANLLGIYTGNNICQNSFINYNRGILIPKFKSLDDLAKLYKKNPLRFAESFALQFVPKLGKIYSLSKSIATCFGEEEDDDEGEEKTDLWSQAKALWFSKEARKANFWNRIETLKKHINDLSKKQDLCVSDVVPALCQTKNILASAIQTGCQIVDIGQHAYQGGQQIYQEGKQAYQEGKLIQLAEQQVRHVKQQVCQTTQDYLNCKSTTTESSSQEQNANNTIPTFPTVMSFVGSQISTAASTAASIVGQQLSRNSLLDINKGLILGVNGDSQSLYNMNGGISFFVNNNSVSTVSGTNTGFIGGGNVSVNAADSYLSNGILGAVNISMMSNNIEVTGNTFALNNMLLKARLNAVLDREIKAKNVTINANNMLIKNDASIRSQNITNVVATKKLLNKGILDGKQTIIQGDKVILDNGSKVLAHGDDGATIIATELNLKNGSRIDANTALLKAQTIYGDEGNTIVSRKGTIIKTAHLDNQGSTTGTLILDFMGDSSQLKGIGTVDNLQYYGTLENNLADTLTDGKNNIVNINQSVTINAGEQNVHLQKEHKINHALKIESSGAIKCDEKLTSSKFIDLKAKDNLDHKSINAGGKVSLAGKNIIAIPTVTRTGDNTNYEDHIDQITITGNGIEVHATEHVFYQAIKTHSGKDGTTMTAGGKNINAAVISENHTENISVNKKTGETTTTKDTFETVHACEHTSEGRVIILADDTVELYGTTFNSKEKPLIDGKNGVNGHIVNNIHTHESEYTKKGGRIRSDKHKYDISNSITTKTVDFVGEQTSEIVSDSHISLPFTSDSSHIILNAPLVEIPLAKNSTSSYFKNDWANCVWESKKSYIKEDVTYSPSFTGIIETNAQKIYCEEVKGHASPTFKTTHNDVVFTRNILEEIHTHQKDSFQRPTRATACIVAMAVAMLTSGIGTSAGAAIATTVGCKSAISTAIVTKVTAAALTTLSTQAADALLKCNGDFVAAAKVIASTNTLKNMVLAAGTSGAMVGAGELLNKIGLPAVQDTHNLGKRLMYAAPHQVVNATIKTAANVIAGQEIKEAIVQNLRSAAANTIGVACTSQIGDSYAKEQIDPVSHKLLHTGVGAIEGAILGGFDGALAGSIGAFVTETVADVIAPEMPSLASIKALEMQIGRPLTQEEFTRTWNDQMSNYWQGVSSTADISRLAAASITLLTRQDVDIANTISATAIDNNFLILAGYGIVTAGVAYSAYQINNAYKEGGPQAALKQLGIEVGTYVVCAGAVKITFKVGCVMYPTAKAAVTAALESEPGLKFALGELAEILKLAGENIGQSALGKSVSTIESHLINANNKMTQKIGNFVTNVAENIETQLINAENKIVQKLGDYGANLAEDLVDQVVPRSVISKMEAQAGKQIVENIENTIVEKLGNLTKPDLVTKITEEPIIHVTPSLDELRQAVLNGEKKILTSDELKKLGFRGDKFIATKGTDLTTGRIRANNELQGGMKKAQEVLDALKKEFENRKLIEQGTETKENCLRIFYKFEDGSHIQLRTEGKSGHVKVDITDVLKNIYEKITFK